jgi:hypothetical protein
MEPDNKKEIETPPSKEPRRAPTPERTGFAYGSLVFGTLSLLAALFLNMTTFGAIMGGMGLGYALVARSSQRRLLVLVGAVVSIAGLLASLWLSGVI